MGELSKERMKAMEDASHLYFDWNTVLEGAGITEVQDLQGQLLLKCPFHADRRPSFRIRLAEHNYHCFSCNAFGTVIDLMWRVSGTAMSKAQYMEQVLRANHAMQQYLGFKSLYLDSKSLHEGFAVRRRFDVKTHIGSSMPVSVFNQKIKKHGRTWENLVFSLSMMQAGERLENIVAALDSKEVKASAAKTKEDAISLTSLLLEDVDEND